MHGCSWSSMIINLFVELRVSRYPRILDRLVTLLCQHRARYTPYTVSSSMWNGRRDSSTCISVHVDRIVTEKMKSDVPKIYKIRSDGSGDTRYIPDVDHPRVKIDGQWQPALLGKSLIFFFLLTSIFRLASVVSPSGCRSRHHSLSPYYVQPPNAFLIVS